MDLFEGILKKVNAPSRDNGQCFVETERLNSIKRILADSVYTLLKDGGVSFIYQHKRRKENKPAVLVSCHIDSLYSKYHHSDYNSTETLGTFDNSICNAALLYLMIRDRLPPNVLIAFTGDEENDCRGAKETADHLRDIHGSVWNNLELVVVLDITSEGYAGCHFTIENYFIEKEPAESLRLRFYSKENFRDYLREKLSGYEDVKFVGAEADPDETWEYAKYDLNCFTFCFPARPHPENEEMEAGYWMHNDLGMLIKGENKIKYSDALSSLLQGIVSDL
jgi:hypothetical protein